MTGSKFFTADQIHDGHGFLPKGSAIEVSYSGTILNVYKGSFTGEAIHIEGLLCPGFVNAHCHLELSHMKGIIPEKTGLIPFLQAVMKTRFQFADEQKKAARHEAFNTMVQHGVVAVGDISNITDTLDLRALDTIHFHTFIESIGFTETHAAARLEAATEVLAAFAAQAGKGVLLRQSITPHAPYSVSEKLFRLIDGNAPTSLLSIHNQETRAEDEYYYSKTGEVRNLLEGLGINDDFFEPSGKSSLQTYLPWLGEDHPLILVHNTFTSPADIAYADQRAQKPYWCLCPNANLYIEGCLPDVTMLAKATEKICVGTDSLASNHDLNILSELQTLNITFPQIGWEALLRWATWNGAVALGMEGHIGSFERGKAPGLVQISELGSSNAVARPLDIHGMD